MDDAIRNIFEDEKNGSGEIIKQYGTFALQFGLDVMLMYRLISIFLKKKSFLFGPRLDTNLYQYVIYFRQKDDDKYVYVDTHPRNVKTGLLPAEEPPEPGKAVLMKFVNIDGLCNYITELRVALRAKECEVDKYEIHKFSLEEVES